MLKMVLYIFITSDYFNYLLAALKFAGMILCPQTILKPLSVSTEQSPYLLLSKTTKHEIVLMNFEIVEWTCNETIFF